MNIAYRRVSTLEQNTDRQLSDLAVAFDKEFEDKASGKDTNRPQLQALLSVLRKGDTVYVHSMDRLGRDMTDLRNLIREITDKGADLVLYKENITCKPEGQSPMSDLILNIFASVAEFERKMIKERIREGIAKAKAEGKYKGRTADMRKKAEMRRRIEDGQKPSQIAEELGVSERTVYRLKKELKPAEV